jgi:hypothetical protein
MAVELVGMVLGFAVALVLLKAKRTLQDRVFFATYRAREHALRGPQKGRLLLALGRWSPGDPGDRERFEILHQPLCDRDLDRRRYVAWLLEPAWVVSAMACLVFGILLATTVLA